MEPGASLHASARIRNARGASDRLRIGSGSIVKGELLLFGHGGEIAVGRWCFVGEGTRIWSAARITIGDRVLISHGVNIFDNLTHPVSPRARHEQFRAIAQRGHPRDIDLGEREVTIAEDVLVAAGATILRGVSVGRGAIIGAGSVVTHDVPPFTIVGGNPARIIRELTAEERT